MKVLFAAFRSDPRSPSAASGAEHQFFRALEASGVELALVPPLLAPPHALERLAARLYRSATGAGYLKYKWSATARAARALSRAATAERPDVIFTLFPAALVFYRGAVPAVYRLDTTFHLLLTDAPEFLHAGRLALAISLWQERRALVHAAAVVTHSERCRVDLIESYGVPADKITVFPNPSALGAVDAGGTPQRLEPPLELLLVGRDDRRKGVDVAARVVDQLNLIGIPARLTVCGLDGEDRPHVVFRGLLDKSDPGELRAYLELYRGAHFLLHPARFDASPMVTAEAAGFGLPALTHDVGGLATAVADGESGVVLPPGSRPEAYVEAILSFLRQPERYRELRHSTRRRYLRELNWDVAAGRLVAVLERAAAAGRRPAGGTT